MSKQTAIANINKLIQQDREEGTTRKKHSSLDTIDELLEEERQREEERRQRNAASAGEAMDLVRSFGDYTAQRRQAEAAPTVTRSAGPSGNTYSSDIGTGHQGSGKSFGEAALTEKKRVEKNAYQKYLAGFEDLPSASTQKMSPALEAEYQRRNSAQGQNVAPGAWAQYQMAQANERQRQAEQTRNAVPSGWKYAAETASGAADVFQATSGQILGAIDKADYWIMKNLGIGTFGGLDINSEEANAAAHAIDQDIQNAITDAKQGKGPWANRIIDAFAAAGNIFGSSAAGFGLGGMGTLSATVAPYASQMASASAPIGSSLATKLAALGTRFAGNVVGDLATSGTNAIISAQSGISTYDTARNYGADHRTAATAGFAAFMAEYISNKMFNGTPLEDSPGQKGYVVELIEDIATKLGKKGGFGATMERALSAFFGNSFVSHVFDKSGEGLEEVITRVIDPFVAKLTYNKDEDLATFSDLLEEYIGGVLMSVVMEIPETATNTAKAVAGAVGSRGDTYTPGWQGNTYNSITTRLSQNPDYAQKSQGDENTAKQAEKSDSASLKRYADIYNRGDAITSLRQGADPAEMDAAVFVNDLEAGNYFYIWETQGARAADAYYEQNVSAAAENRKAQTENEYRRLWAAPQQQAAPPAATPPLPQQSAQGNAATPPAPPVPQNAAQRPTEAPAQSGPPVPTRTGGAAQQSASETATEGKLRIPEQKNTPPVPRSGLTVRSENATLRENRTEESNGQAETAASSEAERETADFINSAKENAGSKVLDRAEWRAGLGRLLQAVRNSRDTRNYEQRRSEATRITNQAEAGNPDRLSAKDLGLANGSDDKLAVEVAVKILGPDAEEAVARLAKQGVTLKFIGGQMRLNKLDANGKPVQVRAYVSDDRKNIIVQADNPRVTWQQLLAHEELHRLIKENPSYRKAVMDALLADKKVAPYLSQIIDRYAEAYHTVDPKATDGEIIEELLADYRAGFDMLDPLGTNRTLSKVTKAAAKDIRAVEKKGTKGESAESEGTENYSIDLTRNMPLKEQFKEYRSGQLSSHQEFYYGTTPQKLAVAGLESVPLVMSQTDYKKSKTDKHNTPNRVMTELAELLSDPILSFEIGDKIGFLVKEIDGDGKPLLIGIEKNVDLDGEKINRIKSAYGLDSPVNWIKNQIGEGKALRIYDEKEADRFLNGFGYKAERTENFRFEDIVTPIQEKNNSKFSMEMPVEETKDLIAVHNLTERNLIDMGKLGGAPAPSIAIVKAENGHSKYGPISLVYGKDTIDPQRSSKNKVYGSDAWTPTAPRVDYELDYDGVLRLEDQIETLSQSVADGIFRDSSILRQQGIDDSTSMTVDELAEKLASKDAIKAAYLADKGEKLETVRKAKEWGKYDNETLQKLIDQIGPQRLAQINSDLMEGKTLGTEENTIRQIIRDYYAKRDESILQKRAQRNGWTAEEIASRREKHVDNMMENNVSYYTLEKFAQDAWAMYEDGGATTGENDYYATQDALRKAVDDKTAKEWIKPQLDALYGKPWLYNGKDPYMANGNRRSFRQMHDAYTLENIVKAMGGQQSQRGQGLWGATATGLQATATPSYGSIAEIKADSGRLGAVSGEDYDAQVSAVDEELTDVINEITGPGAHFSDREIAGSLLVDAAQGSKTVAAIRNLFAKESDLRVSEATAKKIQQLYQHAAALPTEYFEAKPMRAVGFDEIVAAIVPDTISDNARKVLTDNGVNTLEYQTGNDNDRLEKLNSLTDAQFSIEIDPDVAAQFSPEAIALREQTRGRRSNPNSRRKVSRVRTNAYEVGGLFNEVEAQMEEADPSNYEYDPVSERRSMNEALGRLREDFDGEVSRLAEEGRQWGGSDLDTAMGILHRYRTEGRATGNYSDFWNWSKTIQEKGTKGGQFVQAFAKYSRTGTGTAAKAAAKVHEQNRLTPAQQKQVKGHVEDLMIGMDAQGAAGDAMKQAKGKKEPTGKQNGKADKKRLDAETRRRKDAERLIREIYDLRERQQDHGERVEDWLRLTGEELAKKITSRFSENAPRQKTTMQTILSDLVGFAEEHALPTKPKAEGERRTAIDTITDYLNNRDAYGTAWARAQEVLRAQYADDQEKLDALDGFLGSTIAYNAEGNDRTMLDAILQSADVLGISEKRILELASAGATGSTIDRIGDELVSQVKERMGADWQDGYAQQLKDAVRRHVTGIALSESAADQSLRLGRLETEASRKLDIDLQKILTESRLTKQDAAHRVADYLIRELDIPSADAAIAAQRISESFMDELAARADRRLQRMFGEKAPRTAEQRDKLLDLLRLGGFTNANVEDAVVDALGIGKLSREEQRRITADMARFGETLDAMQEDDLEGLRQLIREQAAVRGTKLSRMSEKVLAGETDVEYLRDFAMAQLASIAGDYAPRSAGEKISTYQTISHLLNMRTALRNVTSNQVFDLIDSAANNVSMLPDMLIGIMTGKRTVGLNKSWASQQKRQGAVQGAGRNLLEVNLDVGVDDRQKSKYGTAGRRTWNLANSKTAGKIMSHLEEAMGYELNTTDEFHKGSVMGETLDSLARFVDRGDMTLEEAQDFAREMALYRSFQDDSMIGTMLSTIKEALNIAGVGEQNGKKVKGKSVHDFGLGDFLTKYTQVPGALVHRAIEFSPLGYAKALYNLGQLANQSRKGENTNAAQRKAALAIGRAITGSGLIALFAALALKGLLRRDEDEDKNAKAAHQAQGLSGTQLNLTALGRWIGGESTEPQDGDVLMDINFLEPLDALMALGTMVAESDDRSLKSLGDMSIDAIWESVSSLSMMQTLRDVAQVRQYYNKDDPDQKPLANQIAWEIAASSVTGFIPSVVRQLAQATDTTYREQYGSKDVNEQIRAKAMNSIPGLRQMLAPKITPLGEDKKYQKPLLNLLNATLNPGNINVYQASDVVDELNRVYDETNDAKIWPERNAPYSITVDKEKWTLTPEERTQYQRTRGQTTAKAMEAVMGTDWYKTMDTTSQAEVLNWIGNFANHIAKKEMLDARGQDYGSKTYDKYYSSWANGTPIEDVVAEKHGKLVQTAEETAAAETIIAEAKIPEASKEEAENMSADAKRYYAGFLKGGVSDNTARELAYRLDGSEASGHEQWRIIYDNSGKESEKAVTSVMTDDMKRNWELAKNAGCSLNDYIKVREDYLDLDGNGKQKQAEWNATLDQFIFSKNEAEDKRIKGTLWQIVTGSESTKNNPYDKDAGQKVIDAKAKGGGSGSGSYAPVRIRAQRPPWDQASRENDDSGLRLSADEDAAARQRGNEDLPLTLMGDIPQPKRRESGLYLA